MSSPASNVPESVPSPPPDTVTIVNGCARISLVSGLSSTEFMLQNTLQVQSGPAGTNAESGVQTFTGQTWAQGNVFVWE